CIVLALQRGCYVDYDDKIFHVKFFVPVKDTLHVHYSWFYDCSSRLIQILSQSSLPKSGKAGRRRR
ncbi:hypothetical protein, partial [Klebsiella pneumoniae]|uniref:hypothetical protein n=1 Tax=Klebsiella pneumoniae TaxID=573 RepID=UPI0025A22111